MLSFCAGIFSFVLFSLETDQRHSDRRRRLSLPPSITSLISGIQLSTFLHPFSGQPDTAFIGAYNPENLTSIVQKDCAWQFNFEARVLVDKSIDGSRISSWGKGDNTNTCNCYPALLPSPILHK